MRGGMFILVIVLAAQSALAQAPVTREDDHGILNPDDAGLDMLTRRIEMGMIDSVTCSLAFNATKYDDHPLARRIARACAEAGIVKAMTWMSMMAANGMGGAPDPEAAARWDRRAAEAGDVVGMFNHGVNLLRGSGVSRDAETGRRFVDRAAAAGMTEAVRLRAGGYDLDHVTPDAEEVRDPGS